MNKKMTGFFISLFSTINNNAMDTPDHVYMLDLPVKQLLKSIRDYKYEETKTLIQKFPQFITKPVWYQEILTPIHIAALVGNNVDLKLMLSISNECVNVLTQSKETPLHVAWRKKTASLLLKNGAIVDAQNALGKTPLWGALFNGARPNYPLVKCLVKYGANVNQRFIGAGFNQTLLHYAASLSQPDIVEILLRHGADPDVLDAEQETPLHNAIRAGCSLKPFEKAGIYAIYVSKPAQDPYFLLRYNAKYFKEILAGTKNEKKVMAFTTLARLFSICDPCKHGRKKQTHNGKIHHVARGPIDLQLFDNITYDFVKDWLGKEGVKFACDTLDKIGESILFQLDDELNIESVVKRYSFVFYYNPLTAYEILSYMIRQRKSLENLPHEINLKARDNNRTLLHVAVAAKNPAAIQWLIQRNIDCTITDSDGKTAIDHLKELDSDKEINKECKKAFFLSFHNKFLKKQLDEKNEKLVTTKFFGKDLILYKDGHPVFLKLLEKRPDKCLFFLKQGTFLNYRNDNSGTCPLVAMLNKYRSIKWKKIPNQDKYLIRLLLEYNAVVTKKYIKAVQDNYLKSLLQNAYDKQECCICGEHPEELSNIPCARTHTDYVCKECYENNLQKCPLCSGSLHPFYC